MAHGRDFEWLLKSRTPAQARIARRDFADLSSRLACCLLRSGVYSGAQTQEMQDGELMGLRNFGKTLLKELRARYPYRGDSAAVAVCPTCAGEGVVRPQEWEKQPV